MIRNTVTDGQYQAVVKFILLQHSPKFFSKKKNGRMPFRGARKTCVDISGILPRFPESLLESENSVCSATVKRKPVLDIHQI